MPSSREIKFINSSDIPTSEIPYYRAELAKIAEVDLDFFPEPWSKNQWEELLYLKQPYVISYLLADGHIIGFTLILLNLQESFSHLLKIYIKSESRKKDLGSALWRENLRILKEIGIKSCYLEVRIDNAAANAFYLSIGFSALHEIKNFYGKGQSALSYECLF